MREYYYLIASLPSLEFDIKAPFSYKVFLERCSGELNPGDMAIIKRASIETPQDVRDNFYMLEEWKAFNMSLRNHLARERVVFNKKNPDVFIRGNYIEDISLMRFSHWAVHSESPLEAERAIDRMRWEKIEELERWHYFDIVVLTGYALKLQILLRWDNVNKGNGMVVLDKIIGAGNE